MQIIQKQLLKCAKILTIFYVNQNYQNKKCKRTFAKAVTQISNFLLKRYKKTKSKIINIQS